MDDLNRTEKMAGYKIAMGSWHDNYTVQGKPYAPKQCHVCLAGTVMAQTLGADITHDLDPDNFNVRTAKRLKALDDFRVGEVGTGFFRMGLDSSKGYPFDREIVAYSQNRRRFKLQMRQLIRDLEAARL